MIRFYYSPGACSLASHIALEENYVQYEGIEVSISKKQNREPDYLKINPRGTVPALVVNGQFLEENPAILTYISRRFKDSRMLPEDPFEEARCVALLTWFSNTAHVARRRFKQPQKFCTSPAEEAGVKADGGRQFWAALREIDSALTDREWLLGNRYTVADPYALVFYRWGVVDGHPMQDLQSYGRLARQLLDRDKVRDVLSREKDTVLLA
jgi:glutathione S-transferase